MTVRKNERWQAAERQADSLELALTALGQLGEQVSALARGAIEVAVRKEQR